MTFDVFATCQAAVSSDNANAPLITLLAIFALYIFVDTLIVSVALHRKVCSLQFRTAQTGVPTGVSMNLMSALPHNPLNTMTTKR